MSDTNAYVGDNSNYFPSLLLSLFVNGILNLGRGFGELLFRNKISSVAGRGTRAVYCRLHTMNKILIIFNNVLMNCPLAIFNFATDQNRESKRELP